MKSVSASSNTITAYKVSATPLEVRTASHSRPWMDATRDRFAYRCLPLVMANQVGWDLLCPISFTAHWLGLGDGDKEDIILSGGTHSQRSPVVGSHFGHGILTFTLGWLFRTSPGHNLWIRGPVNAPKDGIAPLEGIVETDWAPYTATMNWQFTRKGEVRFEAGEPICTVLPYPRGYAEGFEPKTASIGENPELSRQYRSWSARRSRFNADLKQSESDAAREKWQRDYMRGRDSDGKAFTAHQTKIEMREFPPYR